jgi:hypothetical protein
MESPWRIGPGGRVKWKAPGGSGQGRRAKYDKRGFDMKFLPLPSRKLNLFLLLNYLSGLTVGPFSRALSLDLDRVLVALEEGQ